MLTKQKMLKLRFLIVHVGQNSIGFKVPGSKVGKKDGSPK